MALFVLIVVRIMIHLNFNIYSHIGNLADLLAKAMLAVWMKAQVTQVGNLCTTPLEDYREEV